MEGAAVGLRCCHCLIIAERCVVLEMAGRGESLG